MDRFIPDNVFANLLSEVEKIDPASDQPLR